MFSQIDEFYKKVLNLYKKSKNNKFIEVNLLYKGDKWFDNIWNFNEGFARVYIKDKGYNFINPQGELLWKEDKWFYEAWDFQTDCVYDIIAKCARVRIDHTVHYISTNGDILKPSSYNNNNNFMGFNPFFV